MANCVQIFFIFLVHFQLKAEVILTWKMWPLDFFSSFSDWTLSSIFFRACDLEKSSYSLSWNIGYINQFWKELIYHRKYCTLFNWIFSQLLHSTARFFVLEIWTRNHRDGKKDYNPNVLIWLKSFQLKVFSMSIKKALLTTSITSF